jgi:hypothetical protein
MRAYSRARYEENIVIDEYELEQWREDDDDRYYIYNYVKKNGDTLCSIDCGSRWLSREDFHKFIEMGFPKRDAVPTNGSIGNKELDTLWERHLSNKIDQMFLESGV